MVVMTILNKFRHNCRVIRFLCSLVVAWHSRPIITKHLPEECGHVTFHFCGQAPQLKFFSVSSAHIERHFPTNKA